MATNNDTVSESLCTHIVDLLLPLTSGEYYYQPCYSNPSATDTFISPLAICNDSNSLLVEWHMSASTDDGTGELFISSRAGL